MEFIDEVLEFPVLQTYGYLFGVVLVGLILFYSGIGFMKVDLVECRRMDGMMVARFFLTKKQREPVEKFLRDLKDAIEQAQGKRLVG